MTPLSSRRAFLGTAAAATLVARRALSDDGRPPVARPRATAFDARIEPDWEERLVVTCGPAGSDVEGFGARPIQAAIDLVAGQGGGTVRLGPGRHVLRAAVRLRSGVRVEGCGADTVITKIPCHESGLAEDSDWYDREITLAPGHGFRVGDSICLRATNPHDGGPLVFKRLLVARSGDRFKLDRALRENVWSSGKPIVQALFPLLWGEEIEGFAVENLHLDGDRARNPELDGNHAGCIFLQDCRDVAIRGVEARNNHGDGISFQICHDVVVEGCTSRDHSGLGLHPGSGSQRPLMRGNTLSGNAIGIFFCWGGEERPRRGERLHRQRRRDLDRPPRHRQPRPLEPHLGEHDHGTPVPAGTGRLLLRPPQPHRGEPLCRQRRRGRGGDRRPGRHRGGGDRGQYDLRVSRGRRPRRYPPRRRDQGHPPRRQHDHRRRHADRTALVNPSP